MVHQTQAKILLPTVNPDFAELALKTGRRTNDKSDPFADIMMLLRKLKNQAWHMHPGFDF